MSNDEMKRMYNRVRMQRYQKEIVSDEMRAKIKEYDRKKAAAYRLKKKLESEKIKEANNTRKEKVGNQRKFQQM